MKSLYLFLALTLAVSQTAHSQMIPSFFSKLHDTISQNLSADTIIVSTITCVMAGLVIRSFFVKQPFSTEPYVSPFHTDEDERRDGEPVAQKEERPFTPFTHDYTDSDLAHFSSINSNFEQPF